jgi:hypothetical protein
VAQFLDQLRRSADTAKGEKVQDNLTCRAKKSDGNLILCISCVIASLCNGTGAMGVSRRLGLLLSLAPFSSRSPHPPPVDCGFAAFFGVGEWDKKNKNSDAPAQARISA